jgi:hypothetical protein
MDPSGTEVSEEVFDEYKSVVERERQVIAAADKADLNRTKIPDPYATWLRFTLGETLELLMWHDNRHLLQGYRVHKLPEFPSA